MSTCLYVEIIIAGWWFERFLLCLKLNIKNNKIYFGCSSYDHIVHLYSRCHTSYVTKYEPHQQEECEDQFRKVCLIDYEKKSIEELVKYCVTPMVKDCNKVGEQVCKTVFQSECFTRQKVHEVQIL